MHKVRYCKRNEQEHNCNSRKTYPAHPCEHLRIHDAILVASRKTTNPRYGLGVGRRTKSMRAMRKAKSVADMSGKVM